MRFCALGGSKINKLLVWISFKFLTGSEVLPQGTPFPNLKYKVFEISSNPLLDFNIGPSEVRAQPYPMTTPAGRKARRERKK